MIATHPNEPWTQIEIVGLILAVLLPFMFFPFSRTLWLASDLSFRPTEPGESAEIRREGPDVQRLVASQMNDVRVPANENPLFAASRLPFGAPPFDRIQDEHFLPAIELGMRQQLAEVDIIAAQSAPATFENTLEALERSGDL